jgi:hypothetical protein
MSMTKAEFELMFRDSLDNMLEEMAKNSEIDVQKFFGMACNIENLAFFIPVIYGMIEESSIKREKRP